MRTMSYDFRRTLRDPETGEYPIVLVIIRHESLDEPVRISSDDTERLSDDPVTYGTVSAAEGGAPCTYSHVLMTQLLPDDEEGQPLAAQLRIEDVEADVGPLLEGIIGGITVDMLVVSSASPDHVEIAYLGLDLTSAQGGDGAIILSAGREDTSLWTAPGDRMTRDRFPGLW